jgi:hypothetical protein
MRRFWINLKGEGLAGHKRTEDSIEWREDTDNYAKQLDRLKKNHCVLVKQYASDTNVFEEERIFRKIVNGGTNVDWAMLDDGSYLAVKFTVKGANSVNLKFRELGFEELVV